DPAAPIICDKWEYVISHSKRIDPNLNIPPQIKKRKRDDESNSDRELDIRSTSGSSTNLDSNSSISQIPSFLKKGKQKKKMKKVEIDEKINNMDEKQKINNIPRMTITRELKWTLPAALHPTVWKRHRYSIYDICQTLADVRDA